MEYRYLGGSGLQISALSLGAWVTFGAQVDDGVAEACMHAAWDAGVNFFDNAEAYADGRAETVMGEIIRRAGWDRRDVVVSTKVFWGGRGPNRRGLSRKHVVEGTRASLARLGLECVDLLFCHRPDLHTPVEETVRAMNWLVDQGYAYYWGTSEWTAGQIEAAHAVARRERLAPPQMEQPQYNMFHRERVEAELLPLYAQFGLGTTVWSPLASGVLTGKYSEGVPAGTRVGLPGYAWLREAVVGPGAQDKIARAKQLEPIARDLGCTPAQLALAWCLRHPFVSTVITGASRPEQVTENLGALAVVGRLTPAVLERIEAVLQNAPRPPTDFRN